MNIKLREPVNGFTHFIGIIFAVTALVNLLNRPGQLSARHTFSFTVFGVAMILLYLSSTLYHWLPLEGKRLELFRKIDHIMIFIFIAACYTPVCLITLRGPWGNWILVAAWAIAIGGFFVKIFWLNAPRVLSTSLYLMMGWMIVIALWPLFKHPSAKGLLIWLGVGGFFYTVGAVIYAVKKPNPWPGVLGFHEIFHLFILAGSFANYWMVYHYV